MFCICKHYSENAMSECNLKNLRDIKKKYKKILVYGVGKCAQIFTEYFGQEQIEKYVDAFVVSDLAGKPEQLFSIPIFCYKNLPSDLTGGVVITAVASNKHNDIIQILDSNKFQRIISMSYEMEFVFQAHSTKQTLQYYERMTRENKLFSYVEIETINRCNGGCSFCPVNRNEKQRPLHVMTEQLFYSIINQLSELDYVGELALFSNNEPFLDNRITTLAQYARENLPQAYIYLYTNGTLLTEEKYLSIMKYLDRMNIDLYLEEEEPLPDNIIKIQQIARKEKLETKMHYFRIAENAVRSTRGGNAPNSKVKYVTEELCRLPLVQMVIRPDGKVSLCCNDALGEMTLGDLNVQTIKDVWYGDAYKNVREKIMRGRENIDICRFCNYIDRRNFEFIKN